MVVVVAALVAVAACGAAMPENAGGPAGTPAEELAKAGDAGQPADGGAEAPDAGPRCPYGALEDAHRGFVRCLEPGESDAGAGRAPEPGDGGAAPSAPPVVEVGTPDFDNGDVPHIDKPLRGARADIAKCVAEHGGLTGSSGMGMIKVQFLVRSRGRAEGVEIVSSKSVSPEAAACVRLALKNRAVGAPSADPVGVTVTFNLKAAPGASAR